MEFAPDSPPVRSSNASPTGDQSDAGSTSGDSSFRLTPATTPSPPPIAESSVTRKEIPPNFLSNHRNEKPDSAWYDNYSSDKNICVSTIRRGFWASGKEMKQLWDAIESEMEKREVLSRDTSRFQGKGTRSALQRERMCAVKAAINGIKHFKSMMSVINRHGDYKDLMLHALRYHCLQRCYFRKIKVETPTPKKKRGRTKTRASSTKAATRTPKKKAVQEPIVLEEEPPDVALGFKTISIGLNGDEDMVSYLPLHLVPEDIGLRKLNLPSDEMKARLQPEDLSLELLKELVWQDCGIAGQISMTCPELEEDIVNERNFQLAIYSLMKMGSELKFMFTVYEMVSVMMVVSLSSVCGLTHDCCRSRNR